MSYLGCSVRLYHQLFVGGFMPYHQLFVKEGSFRMFGSSLPPVVCRRIHALFRMFGSSLPPVVCRRVHVCKRVHALFRMFGSSLPQTIVCRRVI